MTQMYGKFGLIWALLVTFSGWMVAQDQEPIFILLETDKAAQKEAWEISLTAAFEDKTLTWVDEAKEADIMIRADDETAHIEVRQNPVQRLSPILEPAPSILLTSDDDAGEVTAVIWPLTQGDCAIEEEETALDLIEADVRAVYEGNCRLLAAFESDTPDDETLIQAQHLFENAADLPAAKVNLIWLVHRTGNKAFTQELVSLEALNAVDDAEKVFWLAKRAQFNALNFDFQGALRDLDRAIALEPDNPLYPTFKGEVYLLLYEWNNAAVAFDAALALDPEFALAYFQRGVLRSTMIKPEEAAADFSRYLELEPRGVYAELARQYGDEE